MRYLGLTLALSFLPLSFMLIQCQKPARLEAGKYDIADQEYSSQNYAMERIFSPKGSFEESHIVDHCLLMSMTGTWVQESGTLKLKYDHMRNRQTCRDSLPEWSLDSSELKIPIRNITPSSYEALLAASDGKPEKWVVWNKTN